MNKLTEELKKVAADFKQAMALFNDEVFNRVPFEGSWTAGQVAEHIYLSVRRLPVVLMRNVEHTDRDPEMYVKELRDIFLNFDAKFVAAENIRPADGNYSIADHSKRVSEILEKLIAISEKGDLNLLCTFFNFPNIGQLTRVEVLNFASTHTQRHIRQMKNIRKYY